MSDDGRGTRASDGTSAGRVSAAGTRYRVRLFGPFREMAGRDRVSVTLPEGASVRELVEALRRELPGLPPSPAVAVGLEYAAPDRALRPGDEVALIPPVSGG